MKLEPETSSKTGPSYQRDFGHPLWVPRMLVKTWAAFGPSNRAPSFGDQAPHDHVPNPLHQRQSVKHLTAMWLMLRA